MKACSKCQSTENDFYKNKMSADGLASWCKVCTKASARQSDQKDPERVRELRRARDARNPTEVTARKMAWKAANPEKARAAWKRWYDSHRDEILEAQRPRLSAYKRANPEVVRNHNHIRRARKYGVGYERVTKTAWLKILEYYEYRCAYCLAHADKLEQDHIIPLSRGGVHNVSNLAPACGACNRSKGTKTAEEWVI